jgi:hypothetical protein
VPATQEAEAGGQEFRPAWETARSQLKKIKEWLGWRQLKPVILASKEAKMGRIKVGGQPRQKLDKTNGWVW